MINKVIIFCDGACKGNPGPGGWAAAFYYVGETLAQHTIKGSEPNTTNNRMELRAAIEALKVVPVDADLVEINTDSQYLQKGITEWIHGWKSRGWKAASGKPVKNQDLWKELDHLTSKFKVEWKWVPAHSGIPENELVDRLAQKACNE